jgi:chorismate mutase
MPRSFRVRRWLGWALAVCLVSGCSATTRFTTADTSAVDRLLGLIKERLDVAPEVARTKWNTKAPIEDLPREQQIIDGLGKQATAVGVDAQTARDFFRGQIEASKIVQQKLHAEWTARRQPPFANVADLGKDIRPVLDRLTPAMMRSLADALPVLQRPGGRQLLQTRTKTVLAGAPGGDAAVGEAVAPLLKLSR